MMSLSIIIVCCSHSLEQRMGRLLGMGLAACMCVFLEVVGVSPKFYPLPSHPNSPSREEVEVVWVVFRRACSLCSGTGHSISQWEQAGEMGRDEMPACHHHLLHSTTYLQSPFCSSMMCVYSV